MFRNLLYCLLLITSSTVIHAQQLVFKNLSIEDGVPAMEVYHLFQDQNGYVWVFTEYGIVKHNGTTFNPVCTNIPFNESVVYAVTESEGKMYFANSKAQIFQIRNDSAFLVLGMENITDEILTCNQLVSDLFLDASANIYLSTFYETFKIPKNRYTIEGGSAGQDHLNSRATKIDQRLHLLTAKNNTTGKNYLKIIDHNGKFIRNLADNTEYMERSTIIKNPKGFYIARGYKIDFIKNNGDSIAHVFEKGIICFKRVQNGHLWVGLANGGLVELDEELNILETYFENTTVSDILFDDQSGIWISTIEKGIYYSKNVDHLSYSNVPALDECITLLKEINHKLFIGTASGNLIVKENDRITHVNLNGNKSYITDIIEFDGAYYLGTKKEVLIISPDLKQVRSLREKFNCYAFAKKSDNELILVSGSAIITKENGKNDLSRFLLDQKPRCIVKRFENELIVSTQKGCFLLQSGLYCPAYLKPLTDKNIVKLKIDQYNNTWICTKGDGLYCLSAQNKLIKYTNVPSNVINDITFSANGMVFLSTNKGAYVKHYKNLIKPSPWNLILDEEIVSTVMYQNDIYIGTKSGLTKLNALKLSQETHYRFHLESIVIKGKKIPKRYFKSDYDHNNIYFNFDVLAFPFPTKKLYYRLEGASPYIGEVNGTQLHLQNLAPGHYTLYVYPKMNVRNAKKQVIRFSFYITPAFWQTNAFSVIVFICIISSIIVFSWIVFYQIRKKEERKTTIEKLLAEYRLTALKAQINPHFMSNSLVAIQQLILTSQTDKANLYIAKFSLLIRYLLNYSDQSVSSLKNEIAMIELYVELEQLRFNNTFLFVLEVDPALDLNEIYIPALITQPLIENAIWHGLLPLATDQNPQLKLRIIQKDDQLALLIEDNGIHLIPTVPKETNNGRKSKGTSLIRNRLESLNQLYETNGTSINYVELMDEKNNKTGTQVSILFSKEMLKKLYDEND